MPAARELAPSPTSPRSRTTTRPAPSAFAKYDAQPPTVPAPTTTRSARSRHRASSWWRRRRAQAGGAVARRRRASAVERRPPRAQIAIATPEPLEAGVGRAAADRPGGDVEPGAPAPGRSTARRSARQSAEIPRHSMLGAGRPSRPTGPSRSASAATAAPAARPAPASPARTTTRPPARGPARGRPSGRRPRRARGRP